MKKIILIVGLYLLGMGITRGAADLVIDDISSTVANQSIIVVGASAPSITVTLKNISRTDNQIALAASLSCTRSGSSIIQSIAVPTIATGKSVTLGSISLAGIATISLTTGNKNIQCRLGGLTSGDDVNLTNNTYNFVIRVVDASTIDTTNNFNDSILESIDPIKSRLDSTTLRGAEGIKIRLIDMMKKIVVPIFTLISILIAMLGFYELMFSTKEDDTKKSTNYIVYGVIGLVIIQTAGFVAWGLVELVSSSNLASQDFNALAGQLYYKLIFPFIKLGMYVVMGILFLVLLTHVVRFLTSGDDAGSKNTIAIMTSTVSGILVILVSKTLVESIYGKESEVIGSGLSDLWFVGSGLLTDQNLTLVYTIINYAMSFIAFVVLVIIIIQTYQLLFQPSDEDRLKKIKSNFLYIFIWLAMIACGYLIVNFLLIQG